jgi:hypothetical protein
MSFPSLQKSVRSCKVDPSWAIRIQTDRFMNPNIMVCPIWNGMDVTGRYVCPDTFYTKNAGCNSAEDRVLVENDQRPRYTEYITLTPNAVENLHGNFGSQIIASTNPSCAYDQYVKGMKGM